MPPAVDFADVAGCDEDVELLFFQVVEEFGEFVLGQERDDLDLWLTGVAAFEVVDAAAAVEVLGGVSPRGGR